MVQLSKALAMESVRWAFRCGSWSPSCSEWLLAARCVQKEEKDRIDQFVFAKDAKSAMVISTRSLPVFALMFGVHQQQGVAVLFFRFPSAVLQLQLQLHVSILLFIQENYWDQLNN